MAGNPFSDEGRRSLSAVPVPTEDRIKLVEFIAITTPGRHEAACETSAGV